MADMLRRPRFYITLIPLLLLAFVWALGERYLLGPDITLDAGYIASTFKWAFVFFAIYLVASFFMHSPNGVSPKRFFFYEGDSGLVKTWIAVSCLILLCWLPYLFLLYPGCLSNDTLLQIALFHDAFIYDIGEGMTDHHPILVTLVMGTIIETGKALFGSAKYGVFIYMLVQFIMFSATMGVFVCYSKMRLKLTNRFCFVALGLIALFPLFPLLCCNMSKDSFFTWIYVLYVIQFFEICRSKGDFLSRRRNLVLFFVVCIFMSLTKKLGIYIILLSVVILLCVGRRKMVRVLFPAGATCIAVLIALPLMLTAVGVDKGGKQELFSVPFNQSGLYALRYPDEYSDFEQQAIDNLLDRSTLAERYNFLSADGVKGYSERGETKDYLRYLLAWSSQGFRHPMTYVDAFLALNAGWISPYPIEVMFDSGYHLREKIGEHIGPIFEHSRNSELTARALEEFYSNWEQTPILNFVISSGFYMTFIPIAALCMLLCRRKAYGLIGLAPIAVYAALNFLSPITIGAEGMRYVMPMVFIAIPTIAWTLYNRANQEDCSGSA